MDILKKIIKELQNFEITPEMESHCSPLPSGKDYIFDNTGIPHSEDTRKKIAFALKGKKLSEEHKESLRRGRKNFIDNGGSSWNKGKTLSDEHKAKVKANHKGMIGKNHSEDLRSQI